MAELTSPVTTTFEMQREAIEQGQQAIEQGIEFQQNMNEAFLGSFESQESAQRRTVELTQSVLHGYFDAVEGIIPGADSTLDELRETVDEQYDVLLENHA